MPLARQTKRPGEVLDGIKAQADEKWLSFEVLQSAAAPLVINFALLGLPDMKDRDYRVFTDGETAARTFVDQSSKEQMGFSVLGGAIAETHHILVHGNVDE
jgi:hypothetical protein